MFKKLCQVTGVGATTARGVLSALPMRDLSVAIVTGDVTALSRAPGIGKKTAQRIVLELKDKVEQQDDPSPPGQARLRPPSSATRSGKRRPPCRRWATPPPRRRAPSTSYAIRRIPSMR